MGRDASGGGGGKVVYDEMPRWMQLSPLVGAVLLAVPVAAQRSWEPAAVALVLLIVAVAVAECLGRAPVVLSSIIVLASVLALLRWRVDSDVAPFYLVAVNAIAGSSWPVRRSAPIFLASLLVVALAVGDLPRELPDVLTWDLGIALGWLGGLGLHTQLRLMGELRAAHEDLEQRAATVERQRIAREIHDVIAHSLTVTMLHLTGARMALESGDRDEAVDALNEAERLGRQSLGDIRRTVGLLGEAGATAAPMPTATDIGALVDDYREAGMPISLTVAGDVESVSMATGLGLFRIVQEALANVGRHAPGAAAAVDLVVGDSEVRVTVRNDAPARVAVGAAVRGDAGAGAGVGVGVGGLGLAGIAERAALLGGQASTGPTSAGGWCVDVRVPRDTE